MMPNDPKRRWWRADSGGVVDCLIRKAYKTGGPLQWRFPWDGEVDWKRVEDDGCWLGPVLTYHELEARFATVETALKRMGDAFDKLLNATSWMCDADEAEVRSILEDVSDLWPKPEAS